MRLRHTILYNPDNPYDARRFQDMLNGSKYKGVLYEIDQDLRTKIKYGEYSDKEYELLEELRTKLWDLLRESNLDFEET